jgi:tetraacyldisaccharide 4'-kinase
MKVLLFLFSIFSQLVCQIKNLLYERKIFKPRKSPLPVISVGNIAFGGTEKTPLVMELMSFLIREGIKPALISRGYKGKWEKRGGVLSDGRKIFGTWKESGDEPFMVSQNIPQAGIFIGKQRLISCQKAKELGFQVAILDDGFQHRRLSRDLDIVLYDPQEKIALREGDFSLKRANILLLKNGVESPLKKNLKEKFPQTEIFDYSVINRGFFRLGAKESLPSESFNGKKILAFCGIARAQRFITLLQEGGMEIAFFFNFPDHYSYPISSLEKIVKKYQELRPNAAMTTEKDAIKIIPDKNFLEKIPVYYLKIGLELEGKFYERIKSFLQNIDNLQE